MPAAWVGCANMCMCSTTVSSRALVSSTGQPSSPKSARQPLAWPGDTSAKTETALPGTAAGRWDSATRQQGQERNSVPRPPQAPPPFLLNLIEENFIRLESLTNVLFLSPSLLVSL